MRNTILLAGGLLLLLGVGCPPEQDPAPPPDYDGPGSEAWGSEDISCDGPEDCLSGEVCLDQICQPDRCSGGLSSTVAPIGEGLTFFQENELAIADGNPYEGHYWIDGYGTVTGNLAYDYSWDADLDPVLDVAGGNLLGTRPDVYAAAFDGYHGVGILSEGTIHLHALDWQPAALAVGDTDGDGTDELVVIEHGTEMAVCEVNPWSCEYWGFSDDLQQYDVAVGDIDADAIEEPIVLLDYQGYYYIHASNLDADLTGQPGTYSVGVDGDRTRIAAGDLDGDRQAEVITLLDGGWWGFFDDSVAAYRAQASGDEGSFALAYELEIDGYTNLVDVAAADTDTDDRAEVVVIADDGIAILLSGGASAFTQEFATKLGITSSPHAVAMADHDGDSPQARLVGGPEPCAGNAIPSVVLMIPPYWAEYADGDANVMYGDIESTQESMEDTVSLGLHVDIGAKASFLEIFAAEFSTSVSWRVSQSWGQSTRMRVGARYKIEGMPDMYGPHYGGVVLSWGCFDAYTYRVDDPAHLVGNADSEEFVLVVPTGGSTSLWSTNRYNAIAEATGTLPKINIPYSVGDVSSYPGTPETITGDPIASQDNLFPNPPNYTVSDVGSVYFWLGIEEYESNSIAMSEEIGASAGITVGGVKVGGGGSIGWGQAYTLSVGSSALFAGGIPALPDDPDTPEDEYATYGYTFTPWVYLDHYTNYEGEDAAVYVVTYTVL